MMTRIEFDARVMEVQYEAQYDTEVAIEKLLALLRELYDEIEELRGEGT